MEELLKKYQNTIIYRQAMIMLIAAPVPAALIKLQGQLLDESTIAFIIITANIFALASMQLNRLNCKFLFIAGNVVSVLATFGILGMYMLGIDNSIIIIYFPILAGLGFMLVGIASTKVKNAIKDKVIDTFNLSDFEAKKTSIKSGAAIIGQVLAIGFYTSVEVEPVMVLIVLEVVNTTLYGFSEIRRWKLIKQMELVL